jgi:hypothetical protein
MKTIALKRNPDSRTALTRLLQWAVQVSQERQKADAPSESKKQDARAYHHTEFTRVSEIKG